MPSEITLINEDCLPAMRKMKDKQFDLALVDPPYGLKTKNVQYGNLTSGKVTRRDVQKWKTWNANVPTDEYYEQLFRVSKNQIIWGINYLGKNFGSGRIVWDKFNTATFSDAEIAYQSFTGGVFMFRFQWNGMIQEDMKHKEKRTHPTQKPVALYKWILKKYARPGDKILDTHGGGCSIAIACYDLDHDAEIYEIDREYYDVAVRRIENHKKQGTLNFTEALNGQ